MSKVTANRGVARNKKPLKNILYHVEVHNKLSERADLIAWEKYKHKDEGYIVLEWEYEGTGMRMWHGPITPTDLKTLLGAKQWAKFCQGKREFIEQRRVDGRNIKKLV